MSGKIDGQINWLANKLRLARICCNYLQHAATRASLLGLKVDLRAAGNLSSSFNVTTHFIENQPPQSRDSESS